MAVLADVMLGPMVAVMRGSMLQKLHGISRWVRPLLLLDLLAPHARPVRPSVQARVWPPFTQV